MELALSQHPPGLEACPPVPARKTRPIMASMRVARQRDTAFVANRRGPDAYDSESQISAMKDSMPAQNSYHSGDVCLLRRAEPPEDAQRLHHLYSQVFHPEEVGVLAEMMIHHLPRLEYRHCFIAEEVATGSIVSAFALIPRTWQMDSVRLKVAEMGLVGTLATRRGRGLTKALNAEFDRTLKGDGYDLEVIQGIPGFYR